MDPGFEVKAVAWHAWHIADEEQSNPVELNIFWDATGTNVIADATSDADRTLRSRNPVFPCHNIPV